jgi:putative two-component system response regulator
MRRHDNRVGRLSGLMCRLLGLDDELSNRIVQAAWTHDIGKRAIPTSILGKPSALDKHEIELLRRHTLLGAEMLLQRGLEFAATVALRHHELWDGSGYPDGMKGDTIPFAARLITICDVYAALRENRPYRTGLTHETAVEIMLQGDVLGNTQPGMFDPALLSVFMRHRDAFDATVAFLDTSSRFQPTD